MFDDLPALTKVDHAAFGGAVTFWEACRQVLDIVWKLNEGTARAVGGLRQRLDLPPSYAAVRVRRGDKRSEASYVGLRRTKAR